MRIEVSIAKTTALPNASHSWAGGPAATGNQLSVFGALKEDKDRISEILQETWESADDWFVHDLS
ncbi:DNA-damage-inducible protein I [Klebsiella pneumoniae]|nr:DNA-damage-inducible protein I [Klebsiella pneumoniae]